MNIIYLPTWATVIFIIAAVGLGILKWSSFVKNQQKEDGEAEKEGLSSQDWKIIYYVCAGVIAIGLWFWFIFAHDYDLGEVCGGLGYKFFIGVVSVLMLVCILSTSADDNDITWQAFLVVWIISLLLITLLFCKFVYGIIWLVVLFILRAIAKIFD